MFALAGAKCRQLSEFVQEGVGHFSLSLANEIVRTRVADLTFWKQEQEVFNVRTLDPI